MILTGSIHKGEFQGAAGIITSVHSAPPVCDEANIPGNPSSMDPTSETKRVSTKFCCLVIFQTLPDNHYCVNVNFRN